jgi:hypothetical protein
MDVVAVPDSFDHFFHNVVGNLHEYASDGVVNIDLNFLHSIGLLKCRSIGAKVNRPLTDYFYVVESHEKITLYNNQFIVWIVPKVVDGLPTTFTLIAEADPENFHLEVVFSSSGIYNVPQLILKVLDYFIADIEENEKVLASMQ